MAWGPWQILLVLAIILILFGGKKLPELAHSLGKSLGEFKKGKEEGDKVDAKPEVATEKADAKKISEPVTPEVVG
jgi:sec-independent protein translocase protein TatA